MQMRAAPDARPPGRAPSRRCRARRRRRTHRARAQRSSRWRQAPRPDRRAASIQPCMPLPRFCLDHGVRVAQRAHHILHVRARNAVLADVFRHHRVKIEANGLHTVSSVYDVISILYGTDVKFAILLALPEGSASNSARRHQVGGSGDPGSSPGKPRPKRALNPREIKNNIGKGFARVRRSGPMGPILWVCFPPASPHKALRRPDGRRCHNPRIVR